VAFAGKKVKFKKLIKNPQFEFSFFTSRKIFSDFYALIPSKSSRSRREEEKCSSALQVHFYDRL